MASSSSMDFCQQQQAPSSAIEVDSETPQLTTLSTRPFMTTNGSKSDEPVAGSSGHQQCQASNSNQSDNTSIYLSNHQSDAKNLNIIQSQSHFRPSAADTERRSYRPQKFCAVCGDKAIACNFNAVTCESCKAFFRRNAYKEQRLKCLFDNKCTIDRVTRRFCSKCRLLKCFQIGMKREWILTDEQKRIKKVKILQNKQSRQRVLNGKSSNLMTDQQRKMAPQRQSIERADAKTEHHDDTAGSQHRGSSSLCSANQTSSSSPSSASSSPSSTTPSCSSPVGSMTRSSSSAGLSTKTVNNQLRKVQMVDASTSCALDEFELDPYGNLAARLVQYCSMASHCQYCSMRLTDPIQLRQQQSQFASMSQLHHYQANQNQFVGHQASQNGSLVAQHQAPQDKTNHQANLNNGDLYPGAQNQVYFDAHNDRQHPLNPDIQSNQQQLLQDQIAHQLHQDAHGQVVVNHAYGNSNDNGNNTNVNHQLSNSRNGCPINHQLQMAVIGSNPQDIINNNGSSNPFPVAYCCINQPNVFPSVTP